MALTVELTALPEDFDAEALGVALARFGAVVAEATQIRLNVTTRFNEAVRVAVRGDPEYTTDYTQDRDFGFVVAKTITQPDGSIDVIVDAAVLSRSAEPGEAARTFEHEGLHIAIEARGESFGAMRGAGDPAACVFASMAGVSAEEYRVERVLCRGGRELRSDSHLAHFGSIAAQIQETIRRASSRYADNPDLQLISQSVSDAFLALATSTAYVAAEIDATGGARDVVVAADVYARILGPRWRAVVTELRLLPPGDVPTAGPRLGEHADRVAARLEDWLTHIGFAWRDTVGGMSFGVLNAPGWARLAATQPAPSDA